MEEAALRLFPLEPYPIQRDFVQSLFRTVLAARAPTEPASIGILESPTGTGKTTSLLCGCIAWLLVPDDPAAKENRSTQQDLFEPDWIRQARVHAPSPPPLHVAVPIARPSAKRPRSREMVGDEALQRLIDLAEAPSDGAATPKGPLRRVYYCSRTHSQLGQVMGELSAILASAGKRSVGVGAGTGRMPAEIRAVALSSRKNTCIHPRVSKLGSLDRVNEACQELLQGDGCAYYGQDGASVASQRLLAENLATLATVDIEEVVKQGRQMGCCPYYGARSHAAAAANIVTVPYNAILSRAAREALGIDLRGALVIFDEAHNLVSAINAMHSVTVTLESLLAIGEGLRRYSARFSRRLHAENFVLFQQLQQIVARAADFLSSRPVPAAAAVAQHVWHVNNFLRVCGIDHINMLKIVDYIRESRLSPKLSSYYPSDGPADGASACLLSNLADLLRSLLAAEDDARILVPPQQSAALKLISLNPSEAMTEICHEASAVILCGGTMKPIDDVVLQLFPAQSGRVHTFSCGHLTPRENILALVVGAGPSDVPFKFTHEGRAHQEMFDDLGQALVNICTIVPDGVVGFFPSYQTLELFLATLNAKTLHSLEGKKKIFIERRGTADIEATLRAYQHAIMARSVGTGALLLAVMGGRLSEGVNFSDRLARAVVVVGQPYPNITDPETRERAEHYARMRGSRDSPTEYLDNACMRTVNQTIGRAIRHRNDYAAIILLDVRYGSVRMQRKLPEWLLDSLKDAASAEGAPPLRFAEAFARLVKVPRLCSRDLIA